MRHVRRWVRNVVRRIPVVGESRVLPVLRGWYERLPFLDRRRKRYARSEARRLLRHLKTRTPHFTVVYDCRVTGLAYGDLLHILLVARFLERRGGRVAFTMVDTEPPHFLADMNRQEIDRFIDDALVIALVVLDSDRSTARRIAESELAEHLELADASGILYEEYTRVRRPFYRDAFNVFNQLMASLKEEEHQEVLFGVDDFQDYLPASYEDRRYVTWHCRYSTRWDQSRLTTDEEFVLGHSALREHFPDSEILIVSDVEGCDHYARMTETHGLDGIAFSKSVSPSFLGDCALIMGSEFFFSYRGGGIMTVAELSTMAWEIVAPVMNETMWNRHRLGCWQGPLQRFTNVPRWRGAGELAGMLARGEVLTEPLGAHVQ